MQDEQKKFQEKLSELLSYARDHENKVTMKEVRDFFEDFALDEQKVTFVCEYLTMEQVDVADYEPGVVPEETEKEKKKPEFSEEELRALQQYLDELPETETPSEEETAELYRKAAEGDYLLLLNNDIEVLSSDFLRELLSYSQRPDVGAVGAKLYYPDDTIQHAGVLMGINGSAGHSHKSYPRTAVGDMYRLVTTQNYMAVTGACLMTKASLYRAFGGLDEEKFAVAYNDVDYCLKLWQKGLLNVYTPRAEAYHYESKSRGLDTLSENAKRYEREKANFYAKYQQYIDNYDPYYNPHFNNLFENFGLK